MSTEQIFTKQTREQVVKSSLNTSTSKQLWSFPKKKRFQTIKTECPHAFYQTQTSTLSHKKVRFTSSLRKVFTQVSDAPLPGTYSTNQEKCKNMPFFAQSREKCKVHSYLPVSTFSNPGPTQYKPNMQIGQKSDKGFTMRPKTAHKQKLYGIRYIDFVQDKQKQAVPSPFSYYTRIQNKGAASNSKFKSNGLGGVAMMKKQPRFINNNPQTPSCWDYSPFAETIKGKSIGGQIGNYARQSFINSIRKGTELPGPGDYDLPSEFGHYKKTASKSKTHLITE